MLRYFSPTAWRSFCHIHSGSEKMAVPARRIHGFRLGVMIVFYTGAAVHRKKSRGVCMKQRRRIILASGSPRRRELLTQAGLIFCVKTAEVDETPTEPRPAAVVEELSRRKAEAVAEVLSRRKAEAVAEVLQNDEGQTEGTAAETGGIEPDAATAGDSGTDSALIVAADTIVALDDEILGKPRDAEDAVRMLKELSGRTHEVYTGVTVLRRAGEDVAGSSGTEEDRLREAVTFSVCTRVSFYPLTEEEIRDYVASGEPLDKAGAYGIQGLGAQLVERIEGDYNNVVGFPLAHFLRILMDMGELTIG